jgi:cytochrome c oxidase subunit I+III
MVIRWMWDTDPGPDHPPVDIGGGIKLPVYVTGAISHAWWAMVVLLLVGGSLFACLLFSYFFLWLVNPGRWPAPDVVLPAPIWPVTAGALYAASSGAILLASRLLAHVPERSAWPFRLVMLAAPPLLAAALTVDVSSHWQFGLRPADSSYGATIYTIAGVQGVYVAVLAIIAAYTVARSLADKLDGIRRATFDSTMLLWLYAVAQGLLGLIVVALFPRLVAG